MYSVRACVCGPFSSFLVSPVLTCILDFALRAILVFTLTFKAASLGVGL
jgi:hypothetical protein